MISKGGGSVSWVKPGSIFGENTSFYRIKTILFFVPSPVGEPDLLDLSDSPESTIFFHKVTKRYMFIIQWYTFDM